MLKGYTPLRLMAADVDDLGVVSAYLQDAIIKLGDIAFLENQRRFALVANRFVWESAGKRRIGTFHRVRCGIHFDDIEDVKYQYLRSDAKDAIIELLSINSDTDGEKIVITLDFAGGGAIRLRAESVNLFLSDISDPWRTRARPRHEE